MQNHIRFVEKKSSWKYLVHIPCSAASSIKISQFALLLRVGKFVCAKTVQVAIFKCHPPVWNIEGGCHLWVGLSKFVTLEADFREGQDPQVVFLETKTGFRFLSWESRGSFKVRYAGAWPVLGAGRPNFKRCIRLRKHARNGNEKPGSNAVFQSTKGQRAWSFLKNQDNK